MHYLRCSYTTAVPLASISARTAGTLPFAGHDADYRDCRALRFSCDGQYLFVAESRCVAMFRSSDGGFVRFIGALMGQARSIFPIDIAAMPNGDVLVAGYTTGVFVFQAGDFAHKRRRSWYQKGSERCVPRALAVAGNKLLVLDSGAGVDKLRIQVYE